MEIQYAKKNERRLLIFEMLLILALGAISLMIYGLYHETIYAAFSTKFFVVLYRQGHIAVLIGAFLLFNTTFFSYASYRSVRMMVLSTASAALAGSYIYFFLTSFMRIAEPMGFDVASAGLQISAAVFLFLVGVVISHFFDEEIIFPSSKSWHSGIPILFGILSAIVTCVIVNFLCDVLSPEGRRWASNALMGIGLVMCLVTFVLEIYRFYHASNRYLIRMGTSVALLSFALIVKLFNGEDFTLLSFVFNIFFLIALLSYIYAAFKYNISMPIVQQKNAERQITLYAENLEKIVQKRTAELKRGNELFLMDIEYAKRIQQSLLPENSLQFSGARFATAYYPCDRLSGDFYDIFMIDSETLGMYVLDVSGHGIPAALMTMFCMNYIKTSERLINQYRAKKPHRNLKHFFDEFNKVNFPDEMHMVMFFAAYDMKHRVLTYCSGGLNTVPFVIKKHGEVIQLDQSIGFPICRVGSFFSPEFHSAKIELEIGDRVFFYTDGLTDKGNNQVFDEAELLELLQHERHSDIETLRQNMVERLTTVLNRLDDDITFFVMEVIEEVKGERRLCDD